jgi:hypothetical protein
MVIMHVDKLNDLNSWTAGARWRTGEGRRICFPRYPFSTPSRSRAGPHLRAAAKSGTCFKPSPTPQ